MNNSAERRSAFSLNTSYQHKTPKESTRHFVPDHLKRPASLHSEQIVILDELPKENDPKLNLRHPVDQSHLSVEEVLEVIGLTWRKVAVTIASCFCYGAFMANNLLPTIVTAAMWKEWPDMEANKPYYNLIFAGQALARLIGSIILIPCQDILGRRNQLLICGFGLLIFTAVTPLCTEFWSYVVIRFFASFAASPLPSTAQVYNIEIVALEARAANSMILQVWQVIHTMIVTGMNIYFTKAQPYNSWKHLYAFSLLFPALALALILVFRVETPRFAASRGQHTRTWVQLCRLTDGGEKKLAERLKVADVYQCRLKEVHVDVASSRSLIEMIGDNFRRVIDCLTDSRYRMKSYILSILWAMTAVGFWGFTTYMTTFFKYIGLSGNSTTFYCLAVQLPGFLIQWWFMQRKGRLGGRLFALRLCCIWCFTGLVALVITIKASPKSKAVLLLFSLWTYMFSNPLWGVIYAYSSESYPTTHRGAAMALFGTVNALCTLLTTFIGSISVDESTAWRYPLIWSCFYFAAFVTALLLHSETRSDVLADDMKEVVSDAVQEAR
eukprot:Blabericola_migrator_1__3443@NODE_2014_length_3417_cov_111_112836_g1280_i0_p1_GENE_NODE_2014_length_3417_cov_111_112836_g1280_i0NODE_2014_length_3417_cov_111_112836_g1280_i0_p1_ORF_typecomplete_len554_score62_19Sugar_tr/PF00083_24/5_7e49MFS_1/PF07690_16/1_1e18MFS_1/PF07690_16/4_9e09MFS_3/PF05977_13/0_0033MFS_3/PF05977_13/0_00058Ndc1_Nup/PF09531_10/8_8e03Ndc1_Nup/PF09531_10/4Ndc1_Nup/PF09531_10/2_6e03_NODE_2014_length_3417_cov_111_112836_g1280_i08502511